MGVYDVSFKHVFRMGGKTFLSLCGVNAELDPLDTDLSNVRERRVDFLAKISAKELLHIEFQSHPETAMSFRMLGYYGEILEQEAERREKLPNKSRHEDLQIRQILVYAGSKPWSPPKPIAHASLQFKFDFLDLRKVDAEKLLQNGDAGDAVLCILCQGGESRGTIRQILWRITNGPQADKGDALARLIILSKLRDAQASVEAEIRDMGIVIDVSDSDILREPIERAHREGFQEGEANGISRGISRGIASTLTEILRVRLGEDQIPGDLQEHLSDLQPEALMEMVSRAHEAHSIDEALGSHVPHP